MSVANPAVTLPLQIEGLGDTYNIVIGNIDAPLHFETVPTEVDSEKDLSVTIP